MILHPPELRTERLLLRPFRIADASRVQQLLSDPEIHETTLLIPYPYEDGRAEKWIATHDLSFYEGRGMTLAVTLQETGEVIGVMGLSTCREHHRAELGYWIGVPYWNQGYCTEAARTVIDYAFAHLNLHKITSGHFECNPASGRVQQKCGMTLEGTLRDYYFRNGRYQTLVVYGLMAPETA